MRITWCASDQVDGEEERPCGVGWEDESGERFSECKLLKSKSKVYPLKLSVSGLMEIDVDFICIYIYIYIYTYKIEHRV